MNYVNYRDSLMGTNVPVWYSDYIWVEQGVFGNSLQLPFNFAVNWKYCSKYFCF
jgi:hypothetical protein